MTLRSFMASRLGTGVVALAALGSAVPANATWTIVAVDPETEEVGSAGATCGPMVWMAAELVPGEGAIVAQAATNIQARNTAAELLAEGADALEALSQITDPGSDDDLSIRQYGIASLRSPSATFTGDDCDDWAGSLEDETFSVQGNILVGEPVVQAAFDAFVASEGEALQDRLLLALEAGAAEGGDSRCDADVAAKSAFLFVAGPDDDRSTVDLTASDTSGAVAALRDKYDDGTLQNCHCDAAGNSRSPIAGTLLLAMLVVWSWRRWPRCFADPSGPALRRGPGSRCAATSYLLPGR